LGKRLTWEEVRERTPEARRKKLDKKEYRLPKRSKMTVEGQKNN